MTEQPLTDQPMTDQPMTEQPEQQTYTVDVLVDNQNAKENLKRVVEKYEDILEEIAGDMNRDMLDKLKSYYSPEKGIFYQEDTASIVFDMGNGESMYMVPVFIPVLYKAQTHTREQLVAYSEAVVNNSLPDYESCYGIS